MVPREVGDLVGEGSGATRREEEVDAVGQLTGLAARSQLSIGATPMPPATHTCSRGTPSGRVPWTTG